MLNSLHMQIWYKDTAIYLVSVYPKSYFAIQLTTISIQGYRIRNIRNVSSNNHLWMLQELSIQVGNSFDIEVEEKNN